MIIVGSERFEFLSASRSHDVTLCESPFFTASLSFLSFLAISNDVYAISQRR